MVEWKTLPSYHPLDRGEEFMSQEEEPKLEKPIIPISQIGATVPEHDPVFKNMVQTVQANIRRGVGQMQIMLQTPAESAIGGRPKAYGKEIREAIKEVAKANEVQIKGLEMPTQSVNNLSGFDMQQRVFDEEKRLRNIQEVKDALNFAADVGAGGGVDIVSFEFPRPVNDARWQPRDDKTGQVKTEKMRFENPGETTMAGVVDTRTGQIMMFRTEEKLFLNRRTDNFEKMPAIDPKTREPTEPQQWGWKDFQRWAKDKNNEEVKKFKQELKRAPSPEELYYWAQFQQQIDQHNGQVAYYQHYTEQEEKIIKDLEDDMKAFLQAKEYEEAEKLKKRIHLEKQNRDHFKDSIASARQHVAELEFRRKMLQPIQKFGLNQSVQSYAELGINAMKETRKPHVKQDLYVGPEIGWPQQYGGHPDEFIELIKNSRKRMVDLLTKPEIEDPRHPDLGKQKNDLYDPRFSKKKAEDYARKHIKGLFDTGHMGMWWEHWKRDPKKSEEQNFKDFENWYTKKVDKMIDEEVIGSVQVVDSASAAHGHLPAGQGIFGDVIKQTVRKLKKSGWTGMMVSEGHEEEKFGEGRILYKTWEHLAGYPGRPSYAPNLPGRSWSQMQHSYMGRTYSPLYMFGSYAPSNEFKLWSEVPLE